MGRNLRRVINHTPISVFLRFMLHVMHNTLNLGTKTKCSATLLCGSLVGWLIDSGKHFFSHVGTEPSLPGYYQYFLGSKCDFVGVVFNETITSFAKNDFRDSALYRRFYH